MANVPSCFVHSSGSVRNSLYRTWWFVSVHFLCIYTCNFCFLILDLSIFCFIFLYFIYAQISPEENKRLSVLCNKLLSAFDRVSTINLHSSTISSVSVVMRAYLDPTDIQSLAYVSKAVFLSMWSMFWVECMIVWKHSFSFHEPNNKHGYDTVCEVILKYWFLS